MTGQSGPNITSAVTSGGATVAGIAALPNTGSNPVLMVLSIATIVLGSAILGSFVYTRLANLRLK